MGLTWSACCARMPRISVCSVFALTTADMMNMYRAGCTGVNCHACVRAAMGVGVHQAAAGGGTARREAADGVAARSWASHTDHKEARLERERAKKEGKG